MGGFGGKRGRGGGGGGVGRGCDDSPGCGEDKDAADDRAEPPRVEDTAVYREDGGGAGVVSGVGGQELQGGSGLCHCSFCLRDVEILLKPGFFLCLCAYAYIYMNV